MKAAAPVDAPRSTLAPVTAIFIVLALVLAALMALYRTAVLEPRLKGEAVANAEVLARSQAWFVAGALRKGSGAERARAVSTALDELPPSLRTLVILKDVYGLSHEDIADELGISVAAAKVRLHRGRKRMREILDEQEGRDGRAARAV